MLMLMFILILMLMLMLMLMFCLMLIEFSVMAAGTQTLTLSRPQQPRRCRERYFFSYFLLKYKRAASYIDVEVNMDLFLFKVGIAGDFVANGNMIFPSQSRFLRRLMVRADQRLLFFSGFSHFLKSFFPPFTTFLLIFLICPTDTLAKAGTRLVLHCSQKPLSRSAISQGG